MSRSDVHQTGLGINDLKRKLQNAFHLRHDEAELVMPFFEHFPLSKGAYFVKAGREAEKVGYLLKGVMREYQDKHGRQITKYIAAPGDFVADVSGLNFHTKARWNIVGETDCELLVLHRNQVAALKAQVPRWTEMEKLFNARCYMAVEMRLIEHLEFDAADRFERFMANKGYLANHVPLIHIASYLGIAPETLSRLRKKLRYK